MNNGSMYNKLNQAYDEESKQDNTNYDFEFLKEFEHNDNNDEDNSYLIGNNVSFIADESDNEIKADIIVNHRKSIRIWGQVKDCNNEPVEFAYIKLIKATPNGLVGIAHTMTDKKGFYQFDVLCNKDISEYTVVVGKAAIGNERIVSTGLSNQGCKQKEQGELVSKCKWSENYREI